MYVSLLKTLTHIFLLQRLQDATESLKKTLEHNDCSLEKGIALAEFAAEFDM